MRVYGEPHGSPLLILQLELHERRLGGKVEPVGLDVASGNGDGLDGLVYRLRSDGLHLDLVLTTQEGSDGTRDGVGAGVARYA